jgi:hypothetical protein
MFICFLFIYKIVCIYLFIYLFISRSSTVLLTLCLLSVFALFLLLCFFPLSFSEIALFQAVILTPPKHVISVPAVWAVSACHSSPVLLALRKYMCSMLSSRFKRRMWYWGAGPRFGVLDRCVRVCGLYLPSNVGSGSPCTLLWHKYLKIVFIVWFVSVMVRYSGLRGTS